MTQFEAIQLLEIPAKESHKVMAEENKPTARILHRMNKLYTEEWAEKRPTKRVHKRIPNSDVPILVSSFIASISGSKSSEYLDTAGRQTWKVNVYLYYASSRNTKSKFLAKNYDQMKEKIISEERGGERETNNQVAASTNFMEG